MKGRVVRKARRHAKSVRGGSYKQSQFPLLCRSGDRRSQGTVVQTKPIGPGGSIRPQLSWTPAFRRGDNGGKGCRIKQSQLANGDGAPQRDLWRWGTHAHPTWGHRAKRSQFWVAPGRWPWPDRTKRSQLRRAGTLALPRAVAPNEANSTVSACKYRIYANTARGTNPFDRRTGGSYNRGDAEGSTEQTTV